MITGVVARLSLATDAARETGSGGAPPEGRGVVAFETGVGVLFVGVAGKGAIGAGVGAIGPRVPASAIALLVPTI